MSFWNPWTQKDAPHEGPYHPVWAPPRWLRHAPSPAGVGAQGLPRIIPPASLSCARTLHPMPSPCLSPRPPLPPFPQPHPSLPASSSSQSCPSLPPSPKALQPLVVWPPACVFHLSRYLRFRGHCLTVFCPSAFAYSFPPWGFPEKSFLISRASPGHAQLKFLLWLTSTHSDGF